MRTAPWFLLCALFGCGIEDDPTLTTVDPASMWQVLAVRASIANTDNGEIWDIDGSAPDIIVKLDCPQGTSGSTAETESYNPSFSGGGCVARADKLVGDGVDLDVRDVDTSLDPDDNVANTNISIRESDLTRGSLSITRTGDLDSLDMSLVNLDARMM